MQRETYKHDKYGVLRTKEEAEKVNNSFGYCPDCKKLVTRDGNSKAISSKLVKHKICN